MQTMGLNSNYLEAFYVCAQTGHFTKAADKLHITQSALSQRIKNLEDDLSVTLIIRDRSGIRLTEQGEELLRYCQTKEQMESQLLGKIKDVQGNQLSGVIRIGGYSSVMRSVILPVLGNLIKDNPGLRLLTVTRELHELRAMLKSGEIDFMILNEKLDQENLVTQLLGYEENVLVKKKGAAVPAVYLDHDEEDKTTLQYLNKRSAKGIERHYLDDIYGIIEGVKLGMGYAVIPRHLIENQKDIEICDNGRVMKTPVVLHNYEQPIYSSLHKAVTSGLGANCLNEFSR
jgi:DNA-binding transcriptional LysR family regulator